MRMWNVLVLFATFVFGSSLAVAGEPDYSQKFHQCMEKAAGETAGMLDCIDDETKAQDAKLNAAYKAAISGLDQSRTKQLQEAQRAWIKFRDANCQFYADPNGGTNAAVAANDCLLSQTASRANELKNMEVKND